MNEDYCDGCCYKELHNGDTSKCNYLINRQCLINERNYKTKGEKE